MVHEIFKRHKEAVLFYSGGKDSLCCLLLMRPYWDRLNVVWVDTGNQFPEVYEHMAKIKTLVPHFTTLRSNVPKYLYENGFPVDVVPTGATVEGQRSFGKTKVTVCSRFDCCRNNIWEPMARYFCAVRPTCVIRGDRGEERLEGPREFDGIEFAFPIFNWTVDQVLSVVHQAPEMWHPRLAMSEGSSLDCMSCMAYNSEHKSRMEYLRTHHPQLHRINVEFFRDYKAEVARELADLEDK